MVGAGIIGEPSGNTAQPKHADLDAAGMTFKRRKDGTPKSHGLLLAVASGDIPGLRNILKLVQVAVRLERQGWFSWYDTQDEKNKVMVDSRFEKGLDKRRGLRRGKVFSAMEQNLDRIATKWRKRLDETRSVQFSCVSMV